MIASDPMAATLRRCVAGVLLTAALSACGPGLYIYTVTAQASRAVEEAKAVQAEERAPYEYWSAVQFLQMAREKAGDADYQIAIRYGRKAVTMSKDARRLSMERGKPWTPPPPSEAKTAAPAPASGQR